MKPVHAARRTGYTLQIQHEPEGRWIDLIPTQPSILAQGFVSTEDDGDGHAHRLLSDPNDPDSEPMEVEAVIHCPQAAAMMCAGSGKGEPLMTIIRPMPSPEQVEARLACLRDALHTNKTKRR